jgi:hypothetical protein
MTAKEEEMESLALNSFLDNIELSEDDIKSRVSLFSYLEALAGAVDYQPDFQQTSITGSTMDGVYWKGYESDLDTMVRLSYVAVVENGDQDVSVKGPVFEMVHENVHPGYTRLKLIKDGPREENNIFATAPDGAKSFCVKENGEYFLSAYKMKYASNLYLHVPEKPQWVVQSSYAYGVEWPDDEELLEHGPAICFSDHSKEDEPPSDMVPSFTCPNWPSKAMEWVTRKRTHWPSAEILETLVKQGCRVVPVGFRGSPNKQVEWRISFTLTERSLIRTFNNTQYKCYALLKMLLKEIIDKEVPEVLSSFHMKNTLLWTIEKTDADIWRPEKMTFAFLQCLENLAEWVKKGYCPSYFIVENNVFDLKVIGENQRKLVSIFERIISEKWKCLLECETFKKNEQFMELIQEQSELSFNKIIENFKGGDPNQIWFNHDKKLFERYEHARTEIFSQLDGHADIDLTIVDHHEMITKLQNERSPSQFHSTAVEPLVLSVMTSLGSHLFAKHENDGNAETLTKAKELMEKGMASDATSGPLKLANFELMNGNTSRCLQITTDVLANQHLVQSLLPQFLPKYIGTSDEQLEKYESFVSSTSTVQERFRTSAAHAVVFFPTEIDASPKAVRFQLNSRVPESMTHLRWLKWAIYDPLVYAHFLRFLCYQNLQNANKGKEELQAIESLIDNDQVGYEMSALNLLGFSYSSMGNVEKAMGFLLKAKEITLLPDAGLWQFGGILSTLLGGSKKKDLTRNQ